MITFKETNKAFTFEGKHAAFNSIEFCIFARKTDPQTVAYVSAETFHQHILPDLVVNGHLVSFDDALVLYDEILTVCKKHFKTLSPVTVFYLPKLSIVSYDTLFHIDDAERLANLSENVYKPLLSTMKSNEEVLNYLYYMCKKDTYSNKNNKLLMPRNLFKCMAFPESYATLHCNYKTYSGKVVLYLNQQFVTFELSSYKAEPIAVDKLLPIENYTNLLSGTFNLH